MKSNEYLRFMSILCPNMRLTTEKGMADRRFLIYGLAREARGGGGRSTAVYRKLVPATQTSETTQIMTWKEDIFINTLVWCVLGSWCDPPLSVTVLRAFSYRYSIVIWAQFYFEWHVPSIVLSNHLPRLINKHEIFVLYSILPRCSPETTKYTYKYIITSCWSNPWQ